MTPRKLSPPRVPDTVPQSRAPGKPGVTYDSLFEKPTTLAELLGSSAVPSLGGPTEISATGSPPLSLRRNEVTATLRTVLAIKKGGTVVGYLGFSADATALMVLLDATGTKVIATFKESEGQTLHRDAAAAILTFLKLKRQSTVAGYLGVDASDDVAILDTTGAKVIASWKESEGETLHRDATAGVRTFLKLLRQSTVIGYLGSNAGDHFVVLAPDGVTPLLTLEATSLATIHKGLQVLGAGVVAGAPTGGDKGTGTVNAVNYYKNGALLGVAPATLGTQYADVGNGVGETALFLVTLPAGQFNADGARVQAHCAGQFVGSATAGRRVRVYFDGNLLYDSGTVIIASTEDWTLEVWMIRDSAGSVRAVVRITDAAGTIGITRTNVAGLTLGGALSLSVTGEASGAGAAANDIVVSSGYVEGWLG